MADVVEAGGSFVKIVLHAGMPLLIDAVLDAMVRAAHDVGLPAYVHAEGPGQAARAVMAGADVLVHVPWTETLSEGVVRLAVARDMTWISTLSIHVDNDSDLARALDNARRFTAAGGRLVYGTDMGNGRLPVGVNDTEILLLEEAGLSGGALRHAVLKPPREQSAGSIQRSLLSAPLPIPDTAADLVDWLAAAHVVSFRIN
ncbi:MAG: hypothetical protein ACTIDO_17555 [Brevibacterium aurantiacum]|uniref:hypothetical protein n=1 Tax=Brevibacterium aurantiacum TaxID=273384 RepID=UPI003F92466F